MTTNRFRKLLAALLVLAAAVVACDASPLPYPPDIQSAQLSLVAEPLGGVTLSGTPGAVRPGGVALRLRDASRPTTPVDISVAADGSFSTTINGFLIDVLRIDRPNDEQPRTLAHLASAGVPDVRRATAPIDEDGDGWAANLDCRDNDAHSFPGAAEVCDGLDNDCDGFFDETAICAGVACVTGADCSDADFCNGNEICDAGRCAAGSSPVCDDGIAATTDVCDPSAHLCDHFPAPDPFCGNGILEAGEDCDDGNMVAGDGCEPDCTVPGCTPAAEFCDRLDNDCDGLVDEGLSCATPCTVDADCDDGLACTTETCTAGLCDPVTPLPCDDGDPATLDYCDEPIGCVRPACGVEVCNGLDDDCDGVPDEDPACVCAAGEAMCGGVCIDILFNDLNCGACGLACPAGQSCTRGVCLPT